MGQLPRQDLLRALVESLRLHQWLKNLLVFVPLSLIVAQINLPHVLAFTAGFVLLGLLTSGTYILNDIIDAEADRHHRSKRHRPFARGSLPLPLALAASLGLILTAIVGALSLRPAFGQALVSYLVLSLAYSLFLKRLALVDVLVIAGLFTLRIVAGIALVDQWPSEWLLIFSIFFFFSLALMKREVELNTIHETGQKSLHGRGYELRDQPLVFTFGVAAGVASLVIFALFVSSMMHKPSAPYATPELLWGVLATLSYWLMHMWLLTARGLMHDDPILQAARDRTSLVVTGVIAVLILAAQLLRI